MLFDDNLLLNLPNTTTHHEVALSTLLHIPALCTGVARLVTTPGGGCSGTPARRQTRSRSLRGAQGDVVVVAVVGLPARLDERGKQSDRIHASAAAAGQHATRTVRRQRQGVRSRRGPPPRRRPQVPAPVLCAGRRQHRRGEPPGLVGAPGGEGSVLPSAEEQGELPGEHERRGGGWGSLGEGLDPLPRAAVGGGGGALKGFRYVRKRACWWWECSAMRRAAVSADSENQRAWRTRA